MTTKRIATEETVTIESLISLIESRATTYGLLARLYQTEVDETLLHELHALRFPTKTGNVKIDEGYQLLATYLSNLWDHSVDDLAIDYARIFIGQGIDAYSAAYPFESVYTSEKRLMMQDARDEVLAIYRSMDLDKKKSWKEGEDHIAVELEFEKVLSERTLTALQENDEDKAFSLLSTQLNFLNDHLLSWVPMMTEDMQKFAKTDFYRGLAFLTEGFLETDEEFLSGILAENE